MTVHTQIRADDVRRSYAKWAGIMILPSPFLDAAIFAKLSVGSTANCMAIEC